MWGAVVCVALGFVGCAGPRGPAEEAVKTVEDALSEVRSEAARYVPDELGDVDQGVAALKAAFAKREYQKVIDDAKALLTRVGSLKEAIATKKLELTGDWGALASGLPAVVNTIKSRLDILASSKKLPAGLTKETLEGAKTSFGNLESLWTQASEAFERGDVIDAVTKGTQAKKTAAEVMKALGMEVPRALAAN
jgi:hypothetical protein